MLKDNSVFSQAINDIIEERIGNQADTIDLRYLTDGALQNSGQTQGNNNSILDTTSDIAHLDTVHVGNEEDMALGGDGVMDEILPIDGSPLGNDFDYAKIHEEANLNQEILKEQSAHLEQTEELEL